MLAHELILDNATFRLQGVTPAWTRYLLMNFRASAVSDDKRDFMLRLCLNMATEALPDAMLAAISPLLCDEATTDVLPQDADLPPVWDRTRVLQVMARALPPRLNTALGPFVKGHAAAPRP